MEAMKSEERPSVTLAVDMESPWSRLDLDLRRTQRKLNLLCSWIHLKFGDDPSLPRSLCHASAQQEPLISTPRPTAASPQPPFHFEEEAWEGLCDPAVDPLKEEPNTFNALQCGICHQHLPSQTLCTEHEMTHCYVKVTELLPPTTILLPGSGEEKGDEKVFSDLPKARPRMRKAKSVVGKGKVLPCPVCGKALCSVTKVREHVRLYHPQHYAAVFVPQMTTPCPDCHRNFFGKASLAAHRRKSHPRTTTATPKKRPLLCTLCHAHFSTQTALTQHRRLHGDAKREPKPCPDCAQPFPTQASLISHLRTSHPPEVYEGVTGRSKAFVCTLCQAAFYMERTLKHHVQKKHASTATPPPPRKRLYVKPTLKRHVCAVCGFATARKYTLQEHVHTHSEERKYKCGLCPYTAKQQTALYLHSVRHRGDPAQCNLCGDMFTNKRNVKKHIEAVHEGRRAYACGLCDKRFKTNTSRKYHVETHAKEGGRQRGLNKEREPRRRAPNRTTPTHEGHALPCTKEYAGVKNTQE